jgi:hypothetical protein
VLRPSANAENAVVLLNALKGKEGAELITELANVQPVTSTQALAKSITSAARVAQSIQGNNWALLESIWNAGDAAGARIKQKVLDAVTADELVTPLSEALRQAQEDVTKIITSRVQQPVPPVIPDPVSKPGRRILKEGKKSDIDLAEAKALFNQIEQDLKPGQKLDISYTIVEVNGDD